MAGGSVYLDNSGGPIPYPTVVGEYGITDVEVGPQYDGVAIEGNVGYYLCTANFVPNYPQPSGSYLWSKSGNWDSIGLTVSHIKRVYNFLTDPVEWTETGAGQTAQELGMDDITQAGPTRVHVSIGLKDIPVVPDWVDVSMGTDFRFNVNISTGYDVILDQFAEIEHLNISNSAASLTIGGGGTLHCHNGLENAGTIYGPIATIAGTGLTNSGLIQGSLGQVTGSLTNTGEIRCEGGSIHAGFQNDGIFKVWGETTIDTPAISGSGTLQATAKLTLQNTSNPDMGVIIEQPITSHNQLIAPHRLQMLGSSISAEGIARITEMQGTLSVLPGKVLQFYGGVLGEQAEVSIDGAGTTLAWRSGDNNGQITASAGGKLLLDELTYDIGNTGIIDITDGTFSLPGPSSPPYNWTGQNFTNDGTIHLDNSQMTFGVFPYLGQVIGPVIKGSGDIELTNGSKIIDPRIAAEGAISIDATSRVEFNPNNTYSHYGGTRTLSAEIINNGVISFDDAVGMIGGSLINNGKVEVLNNAVSYTHLTLPTKA